MIEPNRQTEFGAKFVGEWVTIERWGKIHRND
jgi:hypothetical protein